MRELLSYQVPPPPWVTPSAGVVLPGPNRRLGHLSGFPLAYDEVHLTVQCMEKAQHLSQ